MAAEKTTIPTKATGDSLTAAEFTELNDKYNNAVDEVNAKEPAKGADDNYVSDGEKVVIGNTSGTNTGDLSTTDELNEGAANLYHTPARAANAPGRRDTAAALDFGLYDDFAITCGTDQALSISNESEGVFFKTFELTGGTIAATLFTHATKTITETNNGQAADYTPGSINDIAAKYVITATTITINWFLKVRE